MVFIKHATRNHTYGWQDICQVYVLCDVYWDNLNLGQFGNCVYLSEFPLIFWLRTYRWIYRKNRAISLKVQILVTVTIFSFLSFIEEPCMGILFIWYILFVMTRPKPMQMNHPILYGWIVSVVVIVVDIKYAICWWIMLRQLRQCSTHPGPCLNIKTVFPSMGILMLKIKPPWSCSVKKCCCSSICISIPYMLDGVFILTRTHNLFAHYLMLGHLWCIAKKVCRINRQTGYYSAVPL